MGRKDKLTGVAVVTIVLLLLVLMFVQNTSLAQWFTWEKVIGSVFFGCLILYIGCGIAGVSGVKALKWFVDSWYRASDESKLGG